MTQKTAQQNTVRPPVIAIIGHIDHGKSTLLDYIRKANITDKEAGGITQHIAAYEVRHDAPDGSERHITFLDTPGHAAFSSIRARGVKIADIGILVVSAEDGVKPQTLEALKAIQEDGLPYIVAINKIDKDTANIEKTKMNLAENGIYIEGYGGNIPVVEISAKTGKGIPELLDMMLLVADLEEFRADSEAPGSGLVLESNLDPKKGLSATLIVKNGTIINGKFAAAGGAIAPIRFMEDFLGNQVKSATFSSPVRIVGWDKLPPVGAEFFTFDTKKEAQEHALPYAAEKPLQAEPLPDAETGILVIPAIVKADTVGSLEAISQELAKLSTEKVQVRVVLSGIGTISENDLRNSEGNPNTVVVSFHAKPDAKAASYALRTGITIHEFDIIYKLTEWLDAYIKERTPKTLEERVTGTAKILKFFSKAKDKQVVGGRVETGMLKSGENIRLMRKDEEISIGKIRELQQNKNKVSEVSDGTEFGAQIECATDITPGDRIQAFESIEQ